MKKVPVLQSLAITVLVAALLMVNVKTAKAYKFSPAPFQLVLKEISAKFGVNIIADPSLDSPVAAANVQGDSVEAALRTLLEPLGYSYTKVENYYLVNGPQSPLTIMAETESSLVPVGFLDSKAREGLAGLEQYFTYDEALGVAYVKAPSSQMNKILAKLWELAKTSGQISIVYSLQIIDLGSTSDLDFVFADAYDSGLTGKKELILTPDQLLLNSPAQIWIKQKAEVLSSRSTRQPWLMTLPGKTVQLTSSLKYLDGDFGLDRYFTLKITPVKVDESTGKVISDIVIGQDMSSHITNSGSTAIQIAGPVHKVSTTLSTIPGKREFVAVVRQTWESNLNNHLLSGLAGFENRKSQQHRDFIVMMTATPVNIESSLATSTGLIPIASLGGFDPLNEEPSLKTKPRPSLEIGAWWVKDQIQSKPWFDFSMPLGVQSSLTLDYRNDNLYSAGLSFYVDASHETSLELLGGKGIGLDDQNVFMLGLGDVTRPSKYVTLFANYYPVSYLLDTKKLSRDQIWRAGTRLGTEKAGITLGASGNPGLDGWNLKLDLNSGPYSWLLSFSTMEMEPTTYWGLGFKF
jgi:hypothetical protein